MKYYTSFVYDFTSENDPLHCTHKYLGTLTSDQRQAVEEIVSTYFLFSGRKLPEVAFTERKMFGPKRDIPVLLPKEFSEKAFLPTLRKALSKFRPDDYSAYTPHVTTDLDSVECSFSGYALMSGDKIIRFWKAD